MSQTTWDVLIVGAGPAGMAAAIAAAARSGTAVAVLDDNAAAGGQIWRQGVGSSQANDAAYTKASQQFAACGAVLLPGYRVAALEGEGALLCWRDDLQQSEVLRFRTLVLATGARERFLPFPGWTLPGVYGAGGLQALVRGGYNVHGKRVIVSGTGPLLMAVAAHLAQDGAQVAGVFEQASVTQLLPFTATLLTQPAKLLQGAQLMLQLRRVPYRTGAWVQAAHGARQLESVTLTDGSRTWNEPCDHLACGYHLVPNTELASLLGCTIQDGRVCANELQQTSVANIFCAGEPLGIAGVDAALHTGRVAGLAAAGDVSGARGAAGRSSRHRSFGIAMDAAFRLRPELLRLARPDTVVCRCEDTPFAALQSLASQSAGWTDAKLQTRCGMGPCQGRICGPAVEALFGWKNQSVRAPIFPIPLEALCNDAAAQHIPSDTAQETA